MNVGNQSVRVLSGTIVSIRPAKLALLALVLAGPLVTVAVLPSCQSKGSNRAHPRVIVIGLDGFDPRLCERMMDGGELPNLAKLRDAGGYRPLGTSTPPQSPVAWATFITGANPGVHGIFDFIHRHPDRQFAPYYSAAETVDPGDGWEVGDHRIPLTFWPFEHNPTRTYLRREGTPFWEYLDQAGVPVWLYDIPANYPPTASKYGHVCCLCGMGTPDLLGTYGTYQFFAGDRVRTKNEEGGVRKPLRFTDHVATAKLAGPMNSLLKTAKRVEVEFRAHRHPTQSVARVEIDDQVIVLREGEWSDWCRVRFPIAMPPFLPDEEVSGICRFYLQQVRPVFRLYVTPVNIDPSDPGDQAVSEPADFVTRIADDLGLFYTSGFQEDHKALSNKVFTDEEYREQANYVLEERLNLLDYATRKYRDGLLFFYFSSTDLQAHMFWWDSDEPHPIRAPDEARKYMAVIEGLYRRLDGVTGELLARYGDSATILLMSDHGFANFRRQFNLNTWLRDNGYIEPADCDSLLYSRRGRDVDWSRTRAYGLGLNGLYLNLKGRERDGIVEPAERKALLDELRIKLLAARDPATGEQVISEVYRRDEVYSGPYASRAPDLLIGYRRGYRSSWATTLGNITSEIYSDNDSAWSADHCMATDEVPGVVFANRPILHPTPSLIDVAPTILQEFGVAPSAEMEGASLFEVPAGARRGADAKE